MNLTFSVFLCILVFATAVEGLPQDQSAERALIQAKQLISEAVNEANAQAFSRAKSILKPFTSHDRLAALVHYHLGYIDYQMGAVVHRRNKDLADEHLDSAITHLDRAVELDKNFAEAYALLSGCYGIKISFSPIKGIFLGPTSGRLIDKAKQLAPENPRVALLGAIGTYNTPSMFGGGKDEGLAAMQRAAELFDRWEDADSLQPSWGREEVYAWIGIAYLDRKELILARKAFEKALQINPHYGWVKYILLPKATEAPVKQ